MTANYNKLFPLGIGLMWSNVLTELIIKGMRMVCSKGESHDYSCFEMAFLYKFLKKQTSRERYVSNITQWRLAEKILKSDFSSNKSSCNALNTLYLEKKHNFPIGLVRALILWACCALRFLLISTEGALRRPVTYDNHPIHSIPSTYSIEGDLSWTSVN